jgi:hypothetical protein
MVCCAVPTCANSNFNSSVPAIFKTGAWDTHAAPQVDLIGFLSAFWIAYSGLTPAAPTFVTFIQGNVKRITFNIAAIQSDNSRSGFVAFHINGREATRLTAEYIPTDFQTEHFTVVAKHLIQTGVGRGGE